MDPISVNERDFIIKSAENGIRVDGRNLNELRDISIKINKTDHQSSSIVSFGDTKVCAITKCEVVEVNPDRGNEGQFYIHVNLSGMGGREFETASGKELGNELQRILERSLKDNNTVDVESLCIIPGESAFALHCYVSVIDNSGNIFDAAVLAATSSLCSFRRPDYSIDGKQVKLYTPREKEPVPICLHYQPICVTFGLLNEKLLLLDPTEREESIMHGKISIILNAFGEMCGFHFLGGAPVSSEVLMKCVNTAKVKAAEMSQILKDALREYVVCYKHVDYVTN